MKGLKAIHVPMIIAPLKQLFTGMDKVVLGTPSSDFG
jgi:hypothetical protein